MIIDSFDDKSMAKINPKPKENRLKCDAGCHTLPLPVPAPVPNDTDAVG